MRAREFYGVTSDEANQRAADWIKSQPSVKVINSRTVSTTVGPSGHDSVSWVVVVKFEGDPH
jgi:hypothetical protein